MSGRHIQIIANINCNKLFSSASKSLSTLIATNHSVGGTMLFITFQPKDCDITKDTSKMQDIYFSVLGYNPVYSICAESLSSAVISTVVSMYNLPSTVASMHNLSSTVESMHDLPSTVASMHNLPSAVVSIHDLPGTIASMHNLPEQVIFFKAKDYHFVNKVEHEQHLLNPANKVYISSRAQLKEALDDHRDKDFFCDSDELGNYVFLINPTEIQIIKAINIQEYLKDATSAKELTAMLQTEREYINHQKDNYSSCENSTEDGIRQTSTKAGIRQARAQIWWQQYAVFNNYFIEHYRSIIGLAPNEEHIHFNMNKYAPQEHNRLFNKYMKNPTQEALDSWREFLLEPVFRG